MQKPPIYAIFLASALMACNNNTTVQHNTDSTISVASTDPTPSQSDVCFQSITGNAGQDTATVHLVFHEAQVSGAMVVKISGKDTRAGILRGTVHGSNIETTWLYTQEGMSDSIPANFKLIKNQLLQQRYSYDPKTGREVLSDTSAYAITFAPAACKLPLQ